MKGVGAMAYQEETAENVKPANEFGNENKLLWLEHRMQVVSREAEEQAGVLMSLFILVICITNHI